MRRAGANNPCPSAPVPMQASTNAAPSSQARCPVTGKGVFGVGCDLISDIHSDCPLADGSMSSNRLTPNAGSASRRQQTLFIDANCRSRVEARHLQNLGKSNEAQTNAHREATH